MTHQMCTGVIREIDDHCNLCGSLNGKTFMRRFRDGTLSVQGTSKCYKVYISVNPGTEPLLRRHGERYEKICPHCGVDSKPVRFLIEEVRQSKFYFNHLTEDELREYNDHIRKLRG